MNYLKISGSLLKFIVLASLLTSCNKEQEVTPLNAADTALNGQNAKISAELKLVKDGGVTLQYIKSGRFISKIPKTHATGYAIEYTCDDSNSFGNY